MTEALCAAATMSVSLERARTGRVVLEKLPPRVPSSEVDTFWSALSDGGEEGPCGWLKDRFGVSWQIIPAAMDELLTDPDPNRSQAAMKAMLTMSKIDLAEIKRAADEA